MPGKPCFPWVMPYRCKQDITALAQGDVSHRLAFSNWKALCSKSLSSTQRFTSVLEGISGKRVTASLLPEFGWSEIAEFGWVRVPESISPPVLCIHERFLFLYRLSNYLTCWRYTRKSIINKPLFTLPLVTRLLSLHQFTLQLIAAMVAWVYIKT